MANSNEMMINKEALSFAVKFEFGGDLKSMMK